MPEQQPLPITVEYPTIRGKHPQAWKMLIYGTPGCGKSTLATHAPLPFFIDLEGGLDRIDCWRTPKRLALYEEVLSALRFAVGNTEIKTVVIDTLDELDTILMRKVCIQGGKATINDFPYGKGGDLLVNEWKLIIDIFEKIRAAGKNVLLIGHEQVVKFEDPTSENYDRYQLKIHKKSAPLVTAKMDAVLFARYETFVKEKEDGRGRRAVGGDRILHTLEAPSWVAKNRFNLPEKIPMTKELFDAII